MLTKKETISFIRLLIFILTPYNPACYDTFLKVVGENFNRECQIVGGNINGECQVVGGNFYGSVSRELERTSMGSVK